MRLCFISICLSSVDGLSLHWMNGTSGTVIYPLLSNLFHKLEEFQDPIAGERLVSGLAVGLCLLLTALRRPQSRPRLPQKDLRISHQTFNLYMFLLHVLRNVFYNHQSRCCCSTHYSNNSPPNYSFLSCSHGAPCELYLL